jgi:hypothetical protein
MHTVAESVSESPQYWGAVYSRQACPVYRLLSACQLKI